MKRLTSWLIPLSLPLSLMAGASSAQAAAPDGHRMAFVVKDWFTAIYETKFMDECPEGVSTANDEFWWRKLSPAERAKLTGNGMVQALNRFGISVNQGEHKENVCLLPDSVQRPRMRTVEGKISYGLDLDGTADGRATPKTCAHDNFVGPDGTPGIDNQLYRLIGCTYGWRKNVGTVDLNANEMRGTSGLGMILIEVTDVDDTKNDDDVTVTFYRSVDQWVQDSSGSPLPFSTYAIDMVDGKPRYGDSAKGSIKNGVIETKAADVRLPYYGNYNFMHPIIKDMHLHLTPTADGTKAHGMVAGYYSLADFQYYIGGLGGVVPVNGIDCPSVVQEAARLADGYPDPKTGQCTALSSAFDLEAYAAFVRHPKTERTAQR